MSTKPPHFFWDENDTNTSPLTSGRMQDGYPDDSVPTAQEFNQLFRNLTLWTKYIDDGDLTINSLDVANDIEADNVYFRSTQTTQLDVHGYTSFGTHNDGDEQSTGAAQVLDVAICLPLGAKIWGYSFRLRGNSSADVTHKLVKIADGVTTDVGAATVSAPNATWQTVFNNFAGEQVVIGTRYAIRFTASAAGIRIGAPTVDWTNEAP